jgi:hypothetical protein
MPGCWKRQTSKLRDQIFKQRVFVMTLSPASPTTPNSQLQPSPWTPSLLIEAIRRFNYINKPVLLFALLVPYWFACHRREAISQS